MTAPSYTCPVCGATSYNPTDVAEGYCGKCHRWTSDSPSVSPVITTADLARCPIGSVSTAHFRSDGTCRCDENDEGNV